MLDNLLLPIALSEKPAARRRGLLVMLPLIVLACAARAGESRIEQSFEAQGIRRVVLRSASADKAQVVRAETTRVTIAGRPVGGAQGNHSPDPQWKETPASEWGMKFVARQFGPVLVVSSQNEIGYIHHVYTVDSITVTLPKGVELVRETRALSGSGEPDLRAP